MDLRNTFFKKILCAVFVVFMGFAVSAQEKNFPPDAGNVKVLGRTVTEDGILWCGYSGTGAAFHVTARSLEVTFAGDSGAKVRRPETNTGLARVAVFVDGERAADLRLSKPEQKILVFSGDEIRSCDVMVIKLSEAANSVAGIKTVSTDADGKISPAAVRPLKIEFIGDSITCGYGVDDEDRNHHFSTATEDVTKTYAYKAAMRLGADWSFVSQSGWGVVSGYTSNPSVKSDRQLMPDYYDKLGFCGNHFGSYSQLQKLSWNFGDFVPDVIVVNLGTNDDSWCKGNSAKTDEFKAGYVEFLRQIRRHNPDSYILCTLGIMGDALFPAVQAAAEQFRSETGDTDVGVFRFSPQSMADGIAADWHPSERTHTKAAATLCGKLESVLAE